jgi:hypothetical protein
MTLPKQGLRNITVENVSYAWNVTGNDGWMHLSVIPTVLQNNLVTATFDYHSKVVSTFITADGTSGASMKQQLIITGYVVRQVILHALKTGWVPTEKGTVLNLGHMDDYIDLRIAG